MNRFGFGFGWVWVGCVAMCGWQAEGPPRQGLFEHRRRTKPLAHYALSYHALSYHTWGAGGVPSLGLTIFHRIIRHFLFYDVFSVTM